MNEFAVIPDFAEALLDDFAQRNRLNSLIHYSY